MITLDHKWTNNMCTVCGCVRERVMNEYIYIRSTRLFNTEPICIDWNKENEKTID